MLKLIKRLLVRSDGQDLIEYALLAAFISPLRWSPLADRRTSAPPIRKSTPQSPRPRRRMISETRRGRQRSGGSSPASSQPVGVAGSAGGWQWNGKHRKCRNGAGTAQRGRQWKREQRKWQWERRGAGNGRAAAAATRSDRSLGPRNSLESGIPRSFQLPLPASSQIAGPRAEADRR